MEDESCAELSSTGVVFLISHVDAPFHISYLLFNQSSNISGLLFLRDLQKCLSSMGLLRVLLKNF